MQSELAATTLIELLFRHAHERGSKVAYRVLPDGEQEDGTLTFEQLRAGAQRVAAEIRERRLAGQPILILCPTGVEYVIAMFGCWLGQAIAVPAAPPIRSTVGRVTPRIEAIIADSGARAALGTAEVCALLQANTTEALSAVDLIVVASGQGAGSAADGAASVVSEPGAPALIQYTSGSTSTPKGVVVTHAQLLAGVSMITAAGRLSPADVGISWMPPYHDMGLIGGILVSFYLGTESILMPPEAFIRRPRRWLAAVSRYRATNSAAPNFALDLCVERIAPVAREGLDLSSLRVLWNGAEPISADSIRLFTETFQPHGLRPQAAYPCYGMAEATLIISGGDPDAAPVIRDYCADSLQRHDAVRMDDGNVARAGAAAGAEWQIHSRRLVGCGRTLPDERILIVDPETHRTLPPGRVGEIWVQSRSVAREYWARQEETKRTFHARTSDTGEGPFLRTGDLGFMDDGELFITGRIKDVIIVRGLNHYPQDIERTVQSVHAALVRDAGAAFAVQVDDCEQLVIVQEFDKRTGCDPTELMAPLLQAVHAMHGIAASAVVLIKRGSLFKTSSGKVQRAATQRAYLSDQLQVVARWSSPSPTMPAEATARDGRATASRSQIRRISQPKTEADIIEWLARKLGEKLRCDPTRLDPHEPLASFGVDSLMAAGLTEELEQWLGTSLPSTISYDNPTMAKLAHVLAGSRSPVRERVPPRPRPVRAAEPIAIVGMACRLPGAGDLDAFWRLLRDGVDAITEVPTARWDRDSIYDPSPGVAGKSCSRWGGFVDGVDLFDAEFFGISDHEAARMDPQQRLFLEVAWEALEDAAQSPAALARSATGVFVGVCASDYARLYRGDLRLIDADYGTGNAPSVIANRLSYLLDLQGPSETVDSACSSSLVALLHAARSLREGQCDLAIVGGVNAVLAPDAHVYFSQIRALARDGRCKAFDRSADGFVRSEGAGALVLKRLADALQAGDRIYALCAGGAVNHDGRSNGLLAPNGLAQQALIERALAESGIGPTDLQYLEAHGVGTPVSDAVELHALGEVMARRDPGDPLLVGSVKSNIGHLEAASGVIGLMKVALALHHEEIPPTLHLREIHPDIAIESMPIEIPTRRSVWLRTTRPRYAGVSAFGFGGTNAHVVLAEAPVPAPSSSVPANGQPSLLTLSAKSATALRSLAMRLGNWLRRSGSGPDCFPDVCFTSNVGRTHFAQRLTLRGTTASEAAEQLLEFARGTPGAGVRSRVLPVATRLKLAFLFAGGAPRPGLYGALYRDHPRFREVVARGDALARPHLDRSIVELLYGGDRSGSAGLLVQHGYAHAASLILAWALHTLLLDWGVRPDVVYGAGAGEFAAAASAGVLDWEQALAGATQRGLLLDSLVPNAPQRVTLRQFKAALAGLAWRSPSVPFVSACLGRAFGSQEVPGSEHFARQVYHTPRPAEDCAALLSAGCDLYLGLGRDAQSDVESQLPPGTWLGVPEDGARAPLLDLVGELYLRGAPIDWSAFHAGRAHRKLSLPTYPFERRRHWLDFPHESRARPHPLITRARG